ncbi:hypothetical protein IW261DRAFT_419701 [Armillaria novae-zelandiae]|uniref:Uncharacterized protein n=1 Tax=Armillaria novae-zelandiae TaxID=153914 RepID=A0AA39TAM3_9AGAR|nr:hypothetical protein IW261DRAFT_419701 [Armillaria novae-zelandiae]
MGQYWQLVNIDKRERLGHMGKLGEAFWCDFTDVMALLAGSWAGCRIMCIGDSAEGCPPNVLTSEEITEINRSTFYRFTCRYKEIRSTGWVDLRRKVLRNLTKHVYIRRDVVVKALKRDRNGQPGDIGNIMLTNVCWSTDSDCTMMLDLTQGGWAGDRFDVVPLSLVEDDEEDWEDVTEDQVKLTRFALQEM